MAFLVAGPSLALPVSVTDVVTDNGDGTWTYDFSVTNNYAADLLQVVYFFGVNLQHNSTQTSPGTFTDRNASWNNAPYGGSNIDYGSTWVDYSFSTLPSGQTLSGFKSTQNFLDTSIEWFAFASGGGGYFGDDAFYQGTNPGVEGVTEAPAPVPEPGTLVLLASGVALFVARRRQLARR